MIYTAICGAYDQARNDILVLGDENRTGGIHLGILESKLFKILSHLFFDETTVWVDGNIFPLADEGRIVDELLGDSDLALFNHPFRQTVRQECEFITITGHNTGELQRDFKDSIDKENLCECGILVRRNNSRVSRFNEKWWALICRYSVRDQVTFPIAAESVPDLKVNVIKANLREHPMFRFVQRPTS